MDGISAGLVAGLPGSNLPLVRPSLPRRTWQTSPRVAVLLPAEDPDGDRGGGHEDCDEDACFEDEGSPWLAEPQSA